MKKKTTKSKKTVNKLFSLNKYILAALFFLVWVIFFDSHSVLKQRNLDKTISKLEADIAIMEIKYQEELKTQAELLQDPERYARDHYFMHKENETVFVINKK